MRDVLGEDLSRSEESRRRLDVRAAAVLRATDAIVDTEGGSLNACDVPFASASQTMF